MFENHGEVEERAIGLSCFTWPLSVYPRILNLRAMRRRIHVSLLSSIMVQFLRDLVLDRNFERQRVLTICFFKSDMPG